MNTLPIEVLLVEDSPDDVALTKEAMEEGKIKVNLHVVGDGVEAMKFVRKIDAYKNAPTPDVVLLDLNLPRKNGSEVLAEMKMDDKLKHIPVIILTTSSRDEDILDSYNHHANCYVTKPVDFDSFTEIVKTIEDFWFTIVRLPK